MLLVRMLVAQIRAIIQVFVAEMHCARLGLIQRCVSVPETLKVIPIMNVSSLNVPTIRTVTYRNRVSIRNVLIHAPYPILVDRMQIATWKIILVYALVIQVQPVSVVFNSIINND